MNLTSEAICNTKPLPLYKEGNFGFIQLKDEKTRYAIYLVVEGEFIPEKIKIPSEFVVDYSKISLLGYSGAIRVQNSNGAFTVTVPKSVRKELEKNPALVSRLTQPIN